MTANDARFRPRPVVVLATPDTGSGGPGTPPPSHPALIELARALGRLAAIEDIDALKAQQCGGTRHERD